MVTICKGKYGKLKAIKSSSIRLEGYLKNGMCSRCRTKWYAIRRWNMLYQTGKAESPLTFEGVNMPRKQWRFWFAFNKDGSIVINWRRKKYKVDRIMCNMPTESFIRKKYPSCCMKGHASRIHFVNQNTTITAIIRE